MSQELLRLQLPVGKGQRNDPDDVEAFDDALRKIGAYVPPPEYAERPQRYTTAPMIGALERFQEQNGLKADGLARPGGPTERAINNRLLGKPRGAGLLFKMPGPLARPVGNGLENDRTDVASVQRGLAALGYLPEDPFDRPRGVIDESTTNAIKAFQRANGLNEDGWLAPGGETEQALGAALENLARSKRREWFDFTQHADRARLGPDTMSGQGRGAETEQGGDAEDNQAADIVPVRAPPQSSLATRSAPSTSRPGGRLIEVNPRYLPLKLPDLRKPVDPPRDLQWSNPGERLRIPAPRKKWLGSPTPGTETLSIDDLPRALGVPADRSIDEQVRRALPIVPKQATPKPKIYIPQPGTPLAIPIVDLHYGGRQGDERTIRTTKEATDAIEETCKSVLPLARIKRKMETYYPPLDGKKGQRKGASYADEWMVMVRAADDLTIYFVTDTYTPKVDGLPIAAEDRRFMKLQHNRTKDEKHIVTVRVPKVWTLGQALDKEKLQTAAREVCEQIKKMIEAGEVGPDKHLRIERMLNELVRPKAKKKPTPQAQHPPDPGK